MVDPRRKRPVADVAGAASGVRRPEVLARLFRYWQDIDTTIDDRIEAAIREKRRAGEVEKAGGRTD